MLPVRVHPGARRAALRGWRDDGALKVDVAAAPEGGRANEAVAALVAEALALPARAVTVVRGRSSRAKVLDVSGLEADEVRRRIDRVLEGRDAG
jgi:uncharacterized protein YggU (UPF0235/DUF167 family)